MLPKELEICAQPMKRKETSLNTKICKNVRFHDFPIQIYKRVEQKHVILYLCHEIFPKLYNIELVCLASPYHPESWKNCDDYFLRTFNVYSVITTIYCASDS